MANKDWQGDFLGFTFNGRHSSEFNIVRVISGSRFEKDLLPPPRDITAEINGRDGSYYFNSTYQSTSFNIQFAYDGVSETNIRELKQWLGEKKEKELIFDEEPYKSYRVKISSQPRLSYICFDNEDKTARIYKGEGTIQFQAFNPYAKVVNKTLNEYLDMDYPNKQEWAEASRLLLSRETPRVYDRFTTNTCNVYNAGDIPAPLMIPEFAAQAVTGYQSITYTIDGNQVGRMILDMNELNLNQHYRINSKLKLIQGFDYDSGIWTLNNKVYNSALIAGDFFDIRPSSEGANQIITLSPAAGQAINIVRTGDNFDIDYDYLYY